MKHYENALENSKAFNHRIRDRIVELSVSLENAEVIRISGYRDRIL